MAAIRTGLVFDHVTAVADLEQELDGALHWTDLQASGDLAMSAEHVAVVLLAGPCAEARAMRRRVDLVFADDAAADDRESVASLELDETRFMAASRDALALVDRDWAAIERVANELAKGRSLEFDEVAAIVSAGD